MNYFKVPTDKGKLFSRMFQGQNYYFPGQIIQHLKVINQDTCEKGYHIYSIHDQILTSCLIHQHLFKFNTTWDINTTYWYTFSSKIVFSIGMLFIHRLFCSKWIFPGEFRILKNARTFPWPGKWICYFPAHLGALIICKAARLFYLQILWFSFVPLQNYQKHLSHSTQM